MSESIIQIQHLNKTFGTGETAVHALEDINLDIRQGEIFGIIGLSGAGKSTLVRCMNLLERPTSGSITVNGQRLAWMEGEKLTTISERELRLARRNVTMIFQSFNLLMQRTCLQNVCFPMELSGLPRQQQRKRAMELLDLVGLRDKADAYPAQLSGGQKQRVAIARSLATDPKVLLCDEATSALDPNTTASILTLLKDLNQKLGVTVVVITHQMSVIEEICSRSPFWTAASSLSRDGWRTFSPIQKPRSAASWCIPAVSRSTGSTPHVSSASPSTAAPPTSLSLPL